MELNKELIFDIISTDDIVIIEAVQDYNKIYKTDFEIVKFIYDEVVFARLKVTKYQISDIFDLGYIFHSFIVSKRQKREIDW